MTELNFLELKRENNKLRKENALLKESLRLISKGLGIFQKAKEENDEEQSDRHKH